MRQRERKKLQYVTAYFVNRCYGGPEEGGWWWDAYEIVETVRCRPQWIERTIDRLVGKHDRLVHRDRRGRPVPIDSVNSRGTLQVLVERRPGQFERTTRPHYE